KPLYIDVESDKLPKRKEYSLLILCSLYQEHWEEAIVVQFNETSYIPDDVTDPTVLWTIIQGCELGGHNLGSDLHYFKKRVGDDFKVRPYIDTMHLMRLAYPEWREAYKLSGAYGLAVGSARIYKELGLPNPYGGLDKKTLQQSFKYNVEPTAQQLEYAKLDVTVLPRLYRHMKAYLESAPYKNLMGAMVATFEFRGLPLDESRMEEIMNDLRKGIRPFSKKTDCLAYNAQSEDKSILPDEIVCQITGMKKSNPLFNVKSPKIVQTALGLTLNSDDQTLGTIATRDGGLEGLTLSKYKLAKEIKDRFKVSGQPRGLRISNTLDAWLWAYYEITYVELMEDCMLSILPAHNSLYRTNHSISPDVACGILEACNIDFESLVGSNTVDTMQIGIGARTAYIKLIFKEEDASNCELTVSLKTYNVQAMIYSSYISLHMQKEKLDLPVNEVLAVFNTYAPTAQELFEQLPPPLTLLIEPFYVHSEYKKKLADVVRKQRKLRTGLAFETRVNYYKQDGRVSANTAKSVAVTSRLQFTEENTSQYSRDIRGIWGVPQDSNKVLIYADFSQIELRSLVQLMGDKTLHKAFINGEDSHKDTTSMIDSSLSRDVLRMLEEQGVGRRPIGKVFNFGGLYGGGGAMLQGRILKELG
ncbi:MAG: hypothetical protein KAJ19_10950, partial [Gammaproteobacteria bacterium]|nr:hypothetical protein [Gammaproteobacteria bacterium]